MLLSTTLFQWLNTRLLRSTYNLSQQEHILSANEKDATLDVCIQILGEDALNRILEYEIGCPVSS